MTYGWRDLPAMLMTAPGRCELRQRGLRSIQPALFAAARLRRHTLDRGRMVIGVTGSYGKSTTVRAIQAVVDPESRAVPSPNSGPSLALHVLLQNIGSRPYVLEVAAGRPGHVDRAARMIAADIGVVTCIGSEHIAALRSLDAIAEEKSWLIRRLTPGGVAVLNGDDERVRSLAAVAPGKTILVGFDPGNDVRALDYELDWPRGARFTVDLFGQPAELQTRLIGRHMAYPLLIALAVARACGVDSHIAAERLARLQPNRGRLQTVALPGGGYVLRDEYKSGIETIETALDVLEMIPARRRIIILGEITEPPRPQRQAHLRVGERAGSMVDIAIVLGKQRDAYRSGLRRGGLAPDQIVDAGRSWEKALTALPDDLGEGDVVLLKGRHDERLERIALALQGRAVGCRLVTCNTPLTRCDDCSMLESGWRDDPPFMQ